MDGVDEMRRTCRTCVREGVDNLKINISGDEFVSHCKAEMTVMMDDEIRTAVEVAHDFGKQIACHARAAGSVKRAVRNGVDVIYHCDFADEEALDLLESVRDKIFVGPAVGLLHNTLYEAEAFGMTPEVCERMGFYRKLEATKATYREMRKRGIRVVPGGDYGFAWTPQGTNARDLEHFVTLFGYSPTEALLSATKVGGELMAQGHELGQIKEGYLADLLLVRGNPVQDVSLLQHQANLAMIMKDGTCHKLDLGAPARPDRRGVGARQQRLWRRSGRSSRAGRPSCTGPGTQPRQCCTSTPQPPEAIHALGTDPGDWLMRSGAGISICDISARGRLPRLGCGHRAASAADIPRRRRTRPGTRTARPTRRPAPDRARAPAGRSATSDLRD